MGQGLGGYFVVLALGVVLTLVVGQILIRTGKAFLEEVFDEQRTADSVARLLAVLFHLMVLGLLAVIATVNVRVGGQVQTIVIKLGIILLVLGIAHGLTMLVLVRLRARHREEEVQEEISAQVEIARAQSTGSPTPPNPPDNPSGNPPDNQSGNPEPPAPWPVTGMGRGPQH